MPQLPLDDVERDALVGEFKAFTDRGGRLFLNSAPGRVRRGGQAPVHRTRRKGATLSVNIVQLKRTPTSQRTDWKERHNAG
jgi:hypothetical protein